MNTENTVINNSGQTQIVEDFSTVSPNCDGSVFAQTFIVKSIDLGDLTTLMITSNECDPIRIANLKATIILLVNQIKLVF